MDAHALLKAYFLKNDIEDGADTVKAVSGYAKKVQKQSPEKNEKVDLAFFKNDKIAAAIKSMEKALKLCENAEKAAHQWPDCSRTADLKWWQGNQESVGAAHRNTADARKEYLLNEKKFGLALKFHWAGLKAGGVIYDSKMKTCKSCADYADVLHKAFAKLARNPIGVGSVTQAECFALSEQCMEYKGLANSILTSLGKIDKKNSDAAKECEAMIRESKAWVAWAGASKPVDDKSLQKSVKAGAPKK